MAAYLRARVVLNVRRNEDEWLESIEETMLKVIYDRWGFWVTRCFGKDVFWDGMRFIDFCGRGCFGLGRMPTLEVEGLTQRGADHEVVAGDSYSKHGHTVGGSCCWWSRVLQVSILILFHEVRNVASMLLGRPSRL
ncbi:uncharacterized protein BCR38DRAFT_127486 [Pseudomassariella vexata]|uniref:Uncharacterized protein n=1 Tax=Pseudomassariella vexata TaxID=1141098 RepID=A0A1Y2D733_9PEZI|nr:uncharacterized protein BCR38DRAFT_127486 [Pseudomassariella vexata]ORY55101.1 hypothetical protein BCR38DRAFT_127486 [Pseudomassariella vexata]